MGGDGRALARVSNDAAYEFIESAGDRPFFAWYAPELPHYPFEAPQPFLERYEDAALSESAKQYYANCTLFDSRLGEFFEYLDARGKLDNTLVVYVNDNGWEQEPGQEFVGDPMRYNNGGDRGKLGHYDLSFRTPVIFAWPGRIKEGEVREQLIHGADIPATILDYVGLALPEGRYGRSFRPVIADASAAGRDAIVGRVNQVRWEGDMMGRKMHGYWIRQDRWFLGWDVGNDELRLFDVASDPRNSVDVAFDHPSVVADLKSRIASWRIRYEN